MTLAGAFWLAADIGGTFTDVVAYDTGTHSVTFAKAPSTPDDPVRGVLDAIGVLAARHGESAGRFLARVEHFVHGTTVATNTLAEGTGPVLGMLTTRGFRDVLELREGTKQDRYALRTPFPEALIARELRLAVDERIAFDGSVTTPLDEHQVRQALAQLRQAGVQAIVVGLLHAHVNPAHELRVRELARQAGWDGLIVLSHEIVNRQGEYARFSTAAVNAYVTPKLAGYLTRLQQQLSAAGGHEMPVMVVQSSGGLLPVELAARLGVGCVTSGPAGGAVACAFLSRAMRRPHAVTFDIGGTTTDISLIEHGRSVERARTDTDACTIAMPSIDIRVHPIGGGSIASVDAGGLLGIGPRSAGAMPGPAAYGRGGTQATLTDAAVVLGYLAAGEFGDGRLSLSHELAARAVQRDVADRLGLSVEDAALAVYALAATRVAEGVRAATVGRGIDPRSLDLIAFGGAGGLYVDMVARELEIATAIAPRAASVFSAFGFLAGRVRFDDSRTLGVPLEQLQAATLTAAFADMRRGLEQRLRSAGFTPAQMHFEFSVECRYARQLGTVEVPAGGNEADAADLRRLADAFEARYEALYAHRHSSQSCVFEGCRVTATGIRGDIEPPRAAGRLPAEAALRGHRRVYGATGWVERPVYDFEQIAPGQHIAGPALLDSASTTIVVEHGSRACIDELGSIVISRAD